MPADKPSGRRDDINYKKRALVIDDEQGIRDLMAFVLKPDGFDVVTASDGVEGLKAYNAGNFDLVLLDIHMPGLNGIQALKEIKKIKPKQAVIMFSSSIDPALLDANESDANGAIACLYKPFMLEDMRTAVFNTMKPREAEK